MAGIASLISYSCLLVTGLPSVVCNVTNLTSEVFIGIGSFFSSLKDIKHHGKETLIYFCLIFVGALIGSLIVSVESSTSFEKIVPFFVLIAAFLIVKPKSKIQHHFSDRTKRWLESGAFFAIFLMGIYCGYFGAASGVVFLALLSVTSHSSFHVYNAIRNISIMGGSIVSVIVFALRANVYWPLVLPLGIGMLIGGYLGPIIVRHVNEKVMKWIIAACALVLSVALFIKAY